MKLAKLSLAAIVVAGLASSSFAASETLADAFKNGKVNGELRAWYFDRDTGTTSEDLFSTGVMLGYVTDSFYGLSLGLTMQSNYAPDADTSAKQMYDGDMYGSGAVLSEAYIAYTIGKTTAKVGRQFISTPLVNGSGSRMIKESFEGALLLNTDLPQTTLAAGYVSKFQGRTSQVTGDGYPTAVNGESDIPDFSKNAVFYGASNFTFDGAYTILAINKSIPNLTITGQYVLVNDVAGATVGDTDVWVGGLGYVVPMSNFKIGLDGGYQASKTDKYNAAGNAGIGYDGGMFGLQASLIDLAGFGLKTAYTSVSSDDNVILGMGNGAGGAVAFTAPLIAGASKVSTADTDAYKIEASYDFTKVGVAGLKLMANYISISADGTVTGTTTKVIRSTDWTYWAGQVAYDIPAVKGLTLSLEYEDAKQEPDGLASVNSDELRFRANYKF
ncbi:OprD family outer membrane porin [Sulfurospirillum multivorans]|uniref:Outer membrane porin n=2 Tax=Sulfurospirillum multivorans TaxID=66821 RepID=A0AA86ALN7_SULMK|nr:OprD family outer membrane porin [Sulfurospirillum multivorans]AHJ11902.1 putative outer membrane porin [Sulfurospirillum multivorans DSM 12446]QEH05408.1 putative outer membrane porin [Sulfurospirillum multivorans]